jgi:hypothetical protein
VIRLFEVKSLEMKISDSHGNTEKINWDENTITILTGRSNVRLSKNSNFIYIFFIYKRRIAGNDFYDNTEPNITVP